MPALQKFLQSELQRRDWSIETFARRVPMSVSRGYQIVNEGQDNVRQSTFDRIAAVFNLTPADLAARTGSPLSDPRQVYVVSADTCSCPDSERHPEDRCKHSIACALVLALIDTQPEPARTGLVATRVSDDEIVWDRPRRISDAEAARIMAKL